jgi:hypothetical protein
MRVANNPYLEHSSVDYGTSLYFKSVDIYTRLRERGEQSLPCETDELLK